MNSSERFTQAVCGEMSAAIAEAGGNEVFFAGKINSEGIVVSVSAAARGHDSAVPVQFEQARQAHVLIHNHPSGVLKPSDADLAIASRAAENAQGFYIIDNDVTSVYAVVEPVKPAVIKKLDLDEACLFISGGGPLEAQSDYFEERPTQIALLAEISRAFNDNAVGVFEAGTGVGKSYAYLIPAMLWALTNKERVIVSTGTINLQQQLAEKDIPAAVKLIDKPVKAVLLKGRQNYVCLRRLNDALAEQDLFSEYTDEFERISQWVKDSSTGSRSDLSFMPSEFVWSRINSESDACMGMRCAHRDQCFVMKVRKEAADANLLIVNHHLLFADIETRLAGAGYDDTAVLPPYKRIIFDEAHGIEAAATSFFSETITRFKLIKQLNIMYRIRRGGAVAGHLFTLDALAPGSDNTTAVIAAVTEIKDAVRNLDEAALTLLDTQYTVRLSDSTANLFPPVLDALEKVRSALTAWTALIRELIDSIAEDERDVPAVWESRAVLRRLEGSAALCKNFAEWDERRDTVFFIEKMKWNASAGKGRAAEPVWYPRFVQTPLEIAPMMNAGVFEPMSSVVCTSATLRIGSTFQFWLHRSGAGFVDEGRVRTGEFASPFPYRTNLLFAVPRDAPFPDDPRFQPFTEFAVTRLITSAMGRTLVLFTSYEALRSACDAARRELAPYGITVLRQGDDDRFRLLETFKNDGASVLFATDSFWEGVDVPGESLSQVIIVKLPFSVPSDPVFAARSEAVERKGGNPFMELSVPDAVIKFRQGFGRLMRRSTDRGCVVVLDRRIMEKRYGRIFLDSVPETKRLYEPLETVCSAVERFL